ncbi:MAG: SDR family oxidoreductase [Clostridia bacterium]|nr:SDR family oxidoreductase [Clostridia bacterium]
MKTVVVTGSARGFGYELVRLFREKGLNVVVCDVSKEALDEASTKLKTIASEAKVLAYVADVTSVQDIQNVIDNTEKELGTIDIWINNAGVNQPNKALWELEEREIDKLIAVDLKGTVLCSKLIMPLMIKQGFGQIYNVEGHGSNDAKIFGLSMYGTAKRAITYFTEALAYEAEEKKTNVLVGKITPGIMITNFIHTSLGDGEKIELDEKTKKIYNILGDYPETIAEFMVDKILNNTKNNVKFTWLTGGRAAMRFMTAGFKKKDYFIKG